ncbi:phosphate ABC transporter substrate-binding protein PstS family protein [Scytonema sp. UIC 10036]|uniref:PstS family phosphate ABC transporter substrate-binding protein n=1 Tax=Scytonema sp. UIC 10036 TaxID=2304196 RepID=UPI0012DABE1F|nr:PstS family phosphate ABC transporter substrate-binding protein [Scytonema sp. UIC 10036]MUH00949.1 phosphate ABC transporter substrate-binding protein PstS family protein [Scytonema sp. UIC 10036]
MFVQNTRIAFVSCVATLLLGASACSNNQADDTTASFPEAVQQAENVSSTSTTNLSGTIKIDGSSTVFPVSKVMAQEFQKANSGVKIDVAFSGTGGGFKKFCAGETDITDASRPINEEEVKLCQTNNIEYIELPVAFDSLSVVVNPKNDFVQCLKVSELKKMWEPGSEGKVNNWNQIRSSFPNQPLKLFGPGSDSGTYDYFTLAVVGQEGKSRSDYTKSENDDALVQGVSQDPNGIGFFGYAYYKTNRDKLKLASIDNGYGCVQPSPQTVADSSYQPLSRPIFIYVKKASATRPEVKAFTNFYLAPENANLVLQVGYVPLPNITLQAASSRFNNGITGSLLGGKGSVIGVGQKGLQEK